MKSFQILFILLLFSSLLLCATDISHVIKIWIEDQGNARVKEETKFYLENETEKSYFKAILKIEGPKLLDFKEFSPKIGYHVRLFPEESRVSAELRGNVGVVRVEYEVKGFAKWEKEKMRRKKWIVTKDLFTFSSEGRFTLPEGIRIVICIPENAKLTDFVPEAKISGNCLEWVGPFTTTQFGLVYKTKVPIKEDIEMFWKEVKEGVEEVKKNKHLIFFLLALLSFLILFLKERYF